MNRMILLGFAIIMPSVIHAGDDLCANADLQATEACSNQRYQAADRELNQVYKTIIRQLAAKPQTLLRQAQRNWIVFRDSNCAAQAWEYNGSNLSTGVHTECLATTTQRRTEELKSVYLNQVVAVEEQQLLGNWRSQANDYGTQISFRIQDGIRHYFATLNNLPFEAGQWRMEQGKLLISSPNGQALHVYHQVIIDKNILTLHEKDNGVEHYQRVDEPPQ